MNKRKREASSDVSGRTAPGLSRDPGDFTHQYINEDATENADFAAVLQQHGGVMSGDNAQSLRQGGDENAAGMAPYHTMTVPQPTEQAFLNQNAENGASVPSEGQMGHAPDFTNHTGNDVTTSSAKPAVGSDEWHKVRKDNHKEVERRRRETINEGINELAKIVPGCEKNKGSILQRAVQFITQLKDNESSNIEKWTLEKMLTEQAIAELSSTCDKLKAECSRAWGEVEQWKKAAQNAGVDIEDEKPAA